MASQDVITKHWAELRGKMRAHWLALTEDDLKTVDGKSEVLLELLREKYGYTAAQAQAQLDKFLEENALHPASA